MIFDKNTAKKTAELLLQIKAIKLQPDEPFTWASGWNSPIYCDNRVTLSYVMIRNYVRENLAKIISEKHGQPDVIAGVATGAIAIGVLVAQELGVPFIYVRPEPKKHGRQNQIEGFLDSGQNVVVVEDLISTGKSSLNAVKALKDAGARVIGMVAIFNYGFPVAEKNFKDCHLDLTTLSDYENLIEQALETNFISTKQVTTLKAWREDPGEWNAK
ncbi:orotate phosphoribosyltransferase [Lutimonas halocynthiae]|uniref:orotate phosphoribosyltransferase n=1 Tax=Lutimonas halocynthiae TaxID=1446477 RepID=UPI0025B28A91|nr:orotate phosphoribosyltransferase [Lutimonas halocynthiae]MDN3644467.1 orotate phosphoribosyltransferase [Lutimonas halocynthiae]